MFIADASEYIALSRAFRRLPGEIKAKAFARAGRRASSQMLTAYVRRAAPRLKLPQKIVRAAARARYQALSNSAEISVKSSWIPLYKLGASQNSKGVRVRLRGSYRHAFIAAMGSGHEGVFMRESKARLPITELYGPNPAHDIVNNDDVYLDVLERIMNEKFAPRALHEVERLLPR